MSDFPDWFNKPPLSPTEHMRYHGYGHEDPSSILPGPAIYDVRAHHARVKALYDAYPFKEVEACKEHVRTILRRVLKGKPLPSDAFGTALLGVIADVLEGENIYAPEFSHSI